MDEYINRSEAIAALTGWGIEPTDMDIEYTLNGIPAADVVEVVHGRWIERKSFHAEGGVSARCSVCRKDIQYLGQPLCYCHNCGARMDGE